jgi:hypothetical protein
MIDRPKKINALLTLLKFSTIFPKTDKDIIIEKINLFSDDDIMNLGKILAFEHKNRESLDQSLVQNFIANLRNKN